jgi:V8-like Glu-specific endopeptidase
MSRLTETQAASASRVRAASCFSARHRTKLFGHDICVTSAHCLYSIEEQKWRPPRRIVFQAGSLTKRDVGTSCYQAYIPNGYMLGYSDLDYAVVRFHGGGANCAQEQYDVGYLGWAMFRDTVGTFSLTTMGYPGINYVNPEWARLHYPVLTYQSEPGIARTNSNAPGFVFHKLDTGRGQSGSPLFQWGCYDAVLVRAVHRGSAGTQANKGIRLSPGVVRSMLFLRAAAKELWGKLS